MHANIFVNRFLVSQWADYLLWMTLQMRSSRLDFKLVNPFKRNLNKVSFL